MKLVDPKEDQDVSEVDDRLAAALWAVQSLAEAHNVLILEGLLLVPALPRYLSKKESQRYSLASEKSIVLVRPHPINDDLSLPRSVECCLSVTPKNS